jgi:hypothetical protein
MSDYLPADVFYQVVVPENDNALVLKLRQYQIMDNSLEMLTFELSILCAEKWSSALDFYSVEGRKEALGICEESLNVNHIRRVNTYHSTTTR